MKKVALAILLVVSLSYSQRVFVARNKGAGGGTGLSQVARVDSVSAELTPNGVTMLWSTSLNVTAGRTNPCIAVTLILSGSSRVDHITFDGNAMTLLADSVDQRLYSYTYIVSTSGAKTIAGHSSNTDKVIVYAYQLEGVNQTTPVGTLAHGSQGYGTTVSATVTLATGDLAYSFYHGWTNDGTPTAPMTAISSYIGTSAQGRVGTRTGNGSSLCEWTFSTQAANTLVIPYKLN
jgi:hypothetical protein